MDQELDSKYGNVRCLDFLRDYFRHTDGSEIFIEIRGPDDNLVEVTFAEADRSSAIIVDRIFPSVMAAHMRDESIRNSIYCGDLVKGSIGQHDPWEAPEPKNARAHKGRQQPFAWTKLSTKTYLDMTREGIMKVDIPLTLSVTKPSNISDSSVATTTLTSV